VSSDDVLVVGERTGVREPVGDILQSEAQRESNRDPEQAEWPLVLLMPIVPLIASRRE
jgi:hypothetical protein